MKKYKVLVYSRNDLKEVFESRTEELGQAMIQINVAGNGLNAATDGAYNYLWHIENTADVIEEDEIELIFGCYSEGGHPMIYEIKTKQ